MSLITGWKNSLKGVGYFLGSALLQVSYETALGVMMGLVLLAMPWAILGLDRNLGTAKKKNASLKEIFVLDNHNLNWLSLARLFLFASRDFWFEVPLPFFLRSPSCEGLGTDVCSAAEECVRGAICVDNICENINAGGGCGGLGLERVVVGAFLGGYIILYGQVQSWTPQLVTGPLKQTPPNKLTEVFWGLINCIPTLVAWIVMSWGPSFENYNVRGMTGWIISVIISFAIIFAINSSIHSYLVVNYASKEKVAVSVGFYYMSNACGRLFGTLGSGILYTYVGEDFGDVAGSDAVAGLAACFLAGTLSSLLAALITLKIDDDAGGLKCGSCCTIVKAGSESNEGKLEMDQTEEIDGEVDKEAAPAAVDEEAPSGDKHAALDAEDETPKPKKRKSTKKKKSTKNLDAHDGDVERVVAAAGAEETEDVVEEKPKSGKKKKRKSSKKLTAETVEEAVEKTDAEEKPKSGKTKKRKSSKKLTAENIEKTVEAADTEQQQQQQGRSTSPRRKSSKRKSKKKSTANEAEAEADVAALETSDAEEDADRPKSSSPKKRKSSKRKIDPNLPENPSSIQNNA